MHRIAINIALLRSREGLIDTNETSSWHLADSVQMLSGSICAPMPSHPFHIHRTIFFAASLAWFQLFAEKRKLVAAIAGVGIAANLMLMQLGISEALFDSAVLHYGQLRADLVMVSPQDRKSV